jgi:hypothetical protein
MGHFESGKLRDISRIVLAIFLPVYVVKPPFGRGSRNRFSFLKFSWKLDPLGRCLKERAGPPLWLLPPAALCLEVAH